MTMIISNYLNTYYNMDKTQYNAYRMKTRNKGMASGRSRSIFTAILKKNKNHIIFRAGLPFYFFTKKNGKNASRTHLQPSNA